MKIVAMPDASYMIETTKSLEDGTGKTVKVPVYLCRCGASRHKPFCDGTHKAIGFKAEEFTISSK
jgi:CDGSH-type Zn-finger protein